MAFALWTVSLAVLVTTTTVWSQGVGGQLVCKSDDDCNPADPNMFCDLHSRSCACRSKDLKLVSELFRCFAVPTSSCESIIGAVSCLPNSECVGGKGSRICKCKSGMVPNTNNECYLPIGARCNKQIDLCDPVPGFLCSPYSNCTCPVGQVFSPVAARCVLLDAPTFLSHGATCDPYETRVGVCDPGKFLNCDLGTLTCACTGTARYDSSTDKCFSVPGQLCSLQNPSVRKPCDTNSQCLLSKGETRCSCRPGFFENEERRCVLPYRSACSSEIDLCDTVGHLACSTSKCECKVQDGTRSWFNPKSRKCEMMADEPCEGVFSMECVSNSQCVQNFPVGTGSTCKCQGSFARNAGGFCSLPFGVDCDPTQEDLCDPFQRLQCSGDSKKCACPHGSRFDVNTLTCHLLAGSDCSDESGLQCGPNSYCDWKGGKGTCVCNAGFLVNRNGICFLRFGSECNPEVDICDPDSFQSCQLGQTSNRTLCGCTNGYNTWWDSVNSMCKLRAGSSCIDGNQECAHHSHCVDGQCVCDDGFSSSGQRLCHFSHGQAGCNGVTGACDQTHGFMSCINDQCVCTHNDTIFEVEDRSCRRVPGRPCLIASTEPKCASNSFCDLKSKSCSCSTGFEDTGIGSCLSSYGHPCSTSSPCNAVSNNLNCFGSTCGCSMGYFELTSPESTSCRPGLGESCNSRLKDQCHPKFLVTCNSNGTCACKDTQTFDSEILQCRTRLGRPCRIGEEMSCVENAFCDSRTNVSGYCTCLSGFGDKDGHGICSTAQSLQGYLGIVQWAFMAAVTSCLSL